VWRVEFGSKPNPARKPCIGACLWGRSHRCESSV